MFIGAEGLYQIPQPEHIGTFREPMTPLEATGAAQAAEDGRRRRLGEQLVWGER